MKLARVLQQHRQSVGPDTLRKNIGDAYLCARNPFFARIRSAALVRGYTFSERDPGGYFGFPLLGLDVVLETRRIPYRDNVTALERLEAARPDFYTLTDLASNRPTPNYLLHEAAHAVAYAEAFGSRPVADAFAERSHLPLVLAGEAFAMTAEYLAACSVSDPLHRWFFSVNSYRHRTQAKKAIGELMLELGERPVVWVLLSGFVASNTLRESLKEREVSALAEHAAPNGGLRRRQLTALRRAVSAAIKMSREFRVDTARLFLCKFGYRRRIERELEFDCVRQVECDDHYRDTLARLVDLLLAPPPRSDFDAPHRASPRTARSWARAGVDA